MPSAGAAVFPPAELFVPRGAADAVDRRKGGEWTPGQVFKNRLIRWALPRALAFIDRLPARILVKLGSVVGRAAALMFATARRTAQERAARCFPAGEARRVARACFARAGENLARCLLLRRESVRALDTVFVSDAARSVFAETLAAGRGAVFVSAHVGPFEAIAAAVAELGLRPAIVVRESYDRALDPLVDEHRIRRGIRVIHRGSPGAGMSIMRALRAGQPVGFLPDLGARVLSVEVEFLGERLAFPIGPQVIAARAKVPLLVGTLSARPSSPGYELSIERVQMPGDPVELTHRVARALERRIVAGPEEWLWMAAPIRRLPSEKSGR